MISLHRSFVTFLIFASGCATALPPASPAVHADLDETTVYLVRHGEKATDDPADPTLSRRGSERADSLATQLRDAGINVIITTNLRRTQLTARPLAEQRRVTPEIISVAGTTAAHVDSVAAAVQRHKGGTILVVGHSNTIGRIAERLGGDKVGDLCDNEYSNLIILSLPRAKPPKMLIERYGPPDPPGDGTCKPRTAR